MTTPVLILIITLIAIAIFLYRNEKSSKKTHNIPPKYFEETEDIVEEAESLGTVEMLPLNSLNFPASTCMEPYCIVVDTETSGLRKFRNKDPKNLSNWPRIVQISWKMFDHEGCLIEEVTEYFKQPRPIPQEAIDIHGITDAICKEHGKDPAKVLTHFANSCAKVEFLVGHNIKFDHDVIEANMRRFKVTDDFEMPCKCTMKASEPLLKLHSNFSGKAFKAPKLDELVDFLFQPSPELKLSYNGHDAGNDTAYTAKCYWELANRGAI